jgi:heterodisulfide reductase subunit A-like polyferredoxin
MLGASEGPPHEAETQIVPRALVIGGSVGGLFAACLLRQIGWDVAVFEKSAGELSGRGAEQPLLQAITDLELPRMAFERVALLGDPAFVARRTGFAIPSG